VAGPNIPPDIDEFLAGHIDTVEQLEVLLLLYHSADRPWTAEAVAEALYSQPCSIARRLATLTGHGLLAEAPNSPSSYRYVPTPASRDEMVRRVAEIYRERRVAVITAIASRPMDNVRAFSDAFRLRKPKEK
jgi:hypothetical protein